VGLRGVPSDLFGHKRPNPEGRKLIEEIRWMEFGAFQEVSQKGFDIAQVFFPNDLLQFRMD
jgi:hypothetical protein